MGRWKGMLLAWVAIILLATGCESEKPAREVAALRKKGNLEAARIRALELLQESPDRMLVWRELAYCDEALCRQSSADLHDRLRYLGEAAVMCAVIVADNNGRLPSDKWGPVCTLVLADAKTQATAALGNVTVHHRMETPPSLTDDDVEDLEFYGHRTREFAEPESWSEADPAEAQAGVRTFARLQALINRLTALESERQFHGQDPEEALMNWAAERSFSTVSASQLFEDGERVVAEACSLATADYAEAGHFQLSTIVESNIFE